MKQSKLRRKRVLRYAVFYFIMLILFVGLLVGPVVAGKFIPSSIMDSVPMDLYQPTQFSNDDTHGSSLTGTGAADYNGYLKTAEELATSTTATS